jgi:hypothetical protein
MIHRELLRSITILIGLYATSVISADPSNNDRAIWSSAAIHLSQIGKQNRTLTSPDGHKEIVTQGYGFRVKQLSSGKELPETDSYGLGGLGEIGWAPDSNAFFVTQSDGGLVGTWSVAVFLISDSGVKQEDVSAAVLQDFEKRYKCDEPQIPEIAAIKWLEGSSELLLLAEVPNHSSCPQMGMVRGYLVSVPDGKIVQELDRKTLLHDWSNAMQPWVLGLLKDDSGGYGD